MFLKIYITHNTFFSIHTKECKEANASKPEWIIPLGLLIFPTHAHSTREKSIIKDTTGYTKKREREMKQKLFILVSSMKFILGISL